MKLVDQVDGLGNIYYDYDISLSSSRIYGELYNYFPGICKTPEGLIVGEFQGKRYAIRCKNITYLGHPHPLFKKRIQIAEDLQAFYNISISKGYEPILLGIYTSKNCTLFCDFNIEDYVDKKAHNSSAHVYSYDLANALTEGDGYFFKQDYYGNRITVFSPERVSVFLSEKLFGELCVQDESAQTTELQTVDKPIKRIDFSPIAHVVQSFFGSMEKKWYGVDCYQQMVSVDYRNRFQPEWPGFYLEYLFEKYIADNHLTNLITYAQDKKKDGIDLDLFFPTLRFYGDLKAHSNHSGGVQGNDLKTIQNLIHTSAGHVYYIVGSHDTEKDADHGYEVTFFWNGIQLKTNLLSYSKRMKYSVLFTDVTILDICQENEKYLKIFRQGINSNGKPREPKIMVDREDFSKFAIFEEKL